MPQTQPAPRPSRFCSAVTSATSQAALPRKDTATIGAVRTALAKASGRRELDRALGLVLASVHERRDVFRKVFQSAAPADRQRPTRALRSNPAREAT